MAPAKKLTPAQSRERRAKIAAAVLGVVFLGVAAIQGPKLLNALNPKPPVAPEAAVLPSAGSSTSSGSLATVKLASDQLSHFSSFPSKDPFKALVKAAGSGSGGAGGATGGSAGTGATSGSAQTQKKLSVIAPAGASGVSATFTETPAGAAVSTATKTVPAALILYNGKKQIVALGAGFPAKHPIFRLVSLGLKSVRIALIGGSFANGKTTLALARNQRISLADSTTGTAFVLRLLRLTTAPASVAPTAGGAATPATPASPAAAGG
jgi:hypothetical protein